MDQDVMCRAHCLIDIRRPCAYDGAMDKALLVELAAKRMEELTADQQARMREIVRKNFYMHSTQCQTEFKYDLTRREVIAMLVMQDGFCDLCGGELTGKWDIDHNHLTGRIRGILHPGCNRGLGQLGDRITRLKQAIEYLQRHGETE
jgi:hypothetical protein